MFGSFFVLVNPHIQPERNDYLELFYPPSLTFLIMSIGLCVLVSIHILSNYEIENKIFKILSRLGRRSLFVYILHCIIISFILKNNFSNLSTLIFLVLDSIFILIIYLSVYLIENKNSLEIINRFPNSIQRIFGLK